MKIEKKKGQETTPLKTYEIDRLDAEKPVVSLFSADISQGFPHLRIRKNSVKWMGLSVEDTLWLARGSA